MPLPRYRSSAVPPAMDSTQKVHPVAPSAPCSVPGFISQMFHAMESQLPPVPSNKSAHDTKAQSSLIKLTPPPPPPLNNPSIGNEEIPVMPSGLVSPTPIRLGDASGLQMLANFSPNVEIVFTDDFSDVDVEVILDVLFNPPTPSPGNRAQILIPNAKLAEIVTALKELVTNFHD
ncbi:hypothetical protein SCHPADRAFT_923774 [Schizopora paradoxa]|uniref:Uncharacterized protein n=1 Tax=Schizopora paradoxa TaxID=27342 RepID=A0A0H2S8W7_9AGAM|nr:hypothetical protein SCHPADRAFT_923774 [Schizopora paradoxa]